MPESKKLSELIEDFVWKTMLFNQYANFSNNVPQSILGKMTDKIDYLKNQIDQKFEELRCECRRGEVKEELKIQERMQNRFREGFNLGIERSKNLCDGILNILNKPIDMTMLFRQINKLVSEEKNNLQKIILPIITLYEEDSEKD